MKILDALAKYKADMNVTMTEDRISLVHAATITRNRHMVKWAISNGSNANLRNRDGITPIMIAARLGDVETIAQLIRYGSSVNDEDVCAVFYLQLLLFLMLLYKYVL
jgi:ankyrin repeat protein